MPYDDSDVKKMIKYQTERKVSFSRSKRISDEVKDLIHCILEAQVERRYTVLQITQHPWMVAASLLPEGVAVARPQTPGATMATVIAGETGATGGRVGATTTTTTTTTMAVGNDTMSQNNNSNADKVWSRLLNNILHSVHSFFSSSTTDVGTTDDEFQLAARYAFERAVDRERLRRKANDIWLKRRSSVHMALRRAWR